MTRDRAAFELFYDTMYVPYARSRFGDAVALRDRRSLRRVALGRGGTILWVEQGGRRIAGQLVERCEGTLNVLSFGTPLKPAAAHAAGVVTAATVAAAEYGLEAGVEWIDLGGCMPWLTDGVLLSKRYWGGELFLRPWLRHSLLLAWSHWAPTAAALLALAPVVTFGRMACGVTSANPCCRLAATDLKLPGLDHLWIVAEPTVEGERPAAGARNGDTRVRLTRPGSSRDILAEISALTGNGQPA